MELVQAQPSEFEVGYLSGRIWINGNPMPSITYFGDFSTGVYLNRDINNVEIQLCSRMNNGASTPSIYPGHYDLMNFLWFRGSEGLYVPTGGK